jgi:hypothetical protein
MAIRWNDFPHGQIQLKFYARLGHNALERSAKDSLRHVLQRKLANLNAEEHRRFVELEASCLVGTFALYPRYIARVRQRP